MTKQRIVGTVVLLALALIFLPMVFDGEGSYQVPLSSRIPDPPQVTVLPEPVQTRPYILADGFPPSDPPATDPDGLAKAMDSPGLGPDGLPQSWSIRLGSFADAANANDLLVKLQDSDYRAYTRSLASGQGELTGVFVGPWLDRTLVEGYQQELQARFGLEAMIVRYRIGE